MHKGEPGQRLDEVAINENLGVGVDGLDSLGLCDQVLLACHGRGVDPKLLGLGPVEVSNAEGAGKGRGSKKPLELHGMKKSCTAAGCRSRSRWAGR
jgi:hypothetical protein